MLWARLGYISIAESMVNLQPLFTALHGMQTRSIDKKAVFPSVRPSVKRVDYDKTEERSVQIFTPYERPSRQPTFLRKESLWGGATPST